MTFDFEQANEMMLKEQEVKGDAIVVLPNEFEVCNPETASDALELALTFRLRHKKYDLLKKEELYPFNAKRDEVNAKFNPMIEDLKASEAQLIEKLAKWLDTDEKFKDVESMKTDLGSLLRKKKRVFEVNEIEKVPLEFLMIDEEKVQKAIKAGVEIPGITTKEIITTNIRLATQE